MRRLERWLHEHLFKVGWLVTKNQRTTTILYYTFFLPGVFLHEFVRWLVAGLLNVRAERAIKIPDEQSIAELKLTFVRIHKNTSDFKASIISASPLIVGIVIIWWISQFALDLPNFIESINAQNTLNLVDLANILLKIPDLWIWVYFVFTIANTMIPSWGALKGWRIVLVVLGIALGILVFLGVADDIFVNNLAEPLIATANVLTLIFALIIGVDITITAILGGLESIIERITGDSATFQNGKLIAMTRQEVQRQREQERLKRERQRTAAAKRTVSGPPSIYNLPFPIPEAPSKDLSQTVTIRREEPAVLEAGEQGSQRQPPALIMGSATQRPPIDDSSAEEIEMPTPPPSLSPSSLFSKPPAVATEDTPSDEDQGDDDDGGSAETTDDESTAVDRV